ncbi:hypothetical protein TNCV_764091 [Trichonephila clavipes]|nr:hypothetical protein TNCV_764091 [Trichonephila clavipes]
MISDKIFSDWLECVDDARLHHFALKTLKFQFMGPKVMTIAGWWAWLVCRWPSAPKVAGSIPAKVDNFHGAENRQRSCRMIIRHIKDH